MHFMPLFFFLISLVISTLDLLCVLTVIVGLIPGSFFLFYFVSVLSFVQFSDYERANLTEVQITDRTLTR